MGRCSIHCIWISEEEASVALDSLSSHQSIKQSGHRVMREREKDGQHCPGVMPNMWSMSSKCIIVVTVFYVV